MEEIGLFLGFVDILVPFIIAMSVTSGVVGAIRKYTPYACCFHRAVCILPLLRINICVYPRYTHLFCCFASP